MLTKTYSRRLYGVKENGIIKRKASFTSWFYLKFSKIMGVGFGRCNEFKNASVREQQVSRFTANKMAPINNDRKTIRSNLSKDNLLRQEVKRLT